MLPLVRIQFAATSARIDRPICNTGETLWPPSQARGLRCLLARFGGRPGRARSFQNMAKDANRLTVCSKKDRKSTRLNSSHANISYAVFCLKKKKKTNTVDI